MLVKPLLGLILASSATAKLTGWPTPASANTGDSTLCLSDDFCFVTPEGAPQDLCEAAERATERLKQLKHRYLSPTRGSEFFPNGAGCGSTLSKLHLKLDGDGTSIEELSHRMAEERPALEAYKLSLNGENGSASSSSSLGLLRALATFETLFYRLDDKLYAPFAPYEIDDKPLFPWRAVLLDTSRNFFSVDTLKRTLDTMQQTKLSVLQWHITDAQSWPLSVAGFEDLAEKGAYDAWSVYSEDDVREVVSYGAKRGVDVLLEIDTPGHTSIIAHARPELIACFEGKGWNAPGSDPPAGLANEPPAGQLRFGDPDVIKFTQGLFDAASSLSASPYFGSGGDELNQNCMLNDPPTQEAMKAKNATLNELLKEFTVQTHATLRNKGKTPIVWEEMALTHGDQGLGNDTLVTVWIDAQNVKAVVDKGFKLIHAANEFFYLDCECSLPGELTPRRAGRLDPRNPRDARRGRRGEQLVRPVQDVDEDALLRPVQRHDARAAPPGHGRAGEPVVRADGRDQRRLAAVAARRRPRRGLLERRQQAGPGLRPRHERHSVPHGRPRYCRASPPARVVRAASRQVQPGQLVEEGKKSKNTELVVGMVTCSGFKKCDISWSICSDQLITQTHSLALPRHRRRRRARSRRTPTRVIKRGHCVLDPASVRLSNPRSRLNMEHRPLLHRTPRLSRARARARTRGSPAGALALACTLTSGGERARGSESVRRHKVLDYGLVLVPVLVVVYRAVEGALLAAAAVQNHGAEEEEQPANTAHNAADYGPNVCVLGGCRRGRRAGRGAGGRVRPRRCTSGWRRGQADVSLQGIQQRTCPPTVSESSVPSLPQRPQGGAYTVSLGPARRARARLFRPHCCAPSTPSRPSPRWGSGWLCSSPRPQWRQ